MSERQKAARRIGNDIEDAGGDVFFAADKLEALRPQFIAAFGSDQRMRDVVRLLNEASRLIGVIQDACADIEDEEDAA